MVEPLRWFKKHQVVHVIERWTGSRWQPVNRLAQVVTRARAEHPEVLFLDDATKLKIYRPDSVRVEGF